MIETWFTADTHFGHTNILQYEKEKRPFSCVEEMNETLIDRWNSVVKSQDIVYHLGDFGFGNDAIRHAERLHGKINLVLGNHDTFSSLNYNRYFNRVYGAHFWKRCILTHIPVHPSSLGSRFFLNVHGHLHSRRVKHLGFNVFQDHPDAGHDPSYFCVSSEQNNLTPFHSSEILNRLKGIY
jgi:calcineurin-like phosphoesterase family protein